jgi:hypothetical protein
MLKVYFDSLLKYTCGYYCSTPCNNTTKTNITNNKPRPNKVYRFEKPDDCPICLEKLDDIEEPLSCGHWFHPICISKCLTTECPLCRKKLYIELIQEKNEGENKWNTFNMQLLIHILVIIGRTVEFSFEALILLNKIRQLLVFWK